MANKDQNRNGREARKPKKVKAKAAAAPSSFIVTTAKAVGQPSGKKK